MRVLVEVCDGYGEAFTTEQIAAKHAELADIIARTSEAPTWVLDGDGVIWDAEAIDPDKVRL